MAKKLRKQGLVHKVIVIFSILLTACKGISSQESFFYEKLQYKTEWSSEEERIVKKLIQEENPSAAYSFAFRACAKKQIDVCTDYFRVSALLGHPLAMRTLGWHLEENGHIKEAAIWLLISSTVHTNFTYSNRSSIPNFSKIHQEVETEAQTQIHDDLQKIKTNFSKNEWENILQTANNNKKELGNKWNEFCAEHTFNPECNEYSFDPSELIIF